MSGEGDMPNNAVPSSIPLINSIFGGYAYSELTAIYGVPMAGKSLLLLQEAYYCLSQGYRVVWIDTEGGISRMHEAWADKFRSRFRVPNRKHIDFITIRSPIRFLRFLTGYDVQIEYGKKTGLTIKGRLKKKDNDLLSKHVRDNTLIIIDSFTQPFRLGFSSDSQNLPARASAMAFALSGLYDIMDSHSNTAAITTVHASLNPTNPYERANPHGGNTILYNAKAVMLLDIPKSKKLSDFRRLIAVRTPYAKSWTKLFWLQIQSDGYHQVDPSKIQEITGYEVAGESVPEEAVPNAD